VKWLASPLFFPSYLSFLVQVHLGRTARLVNSRREQFRESEGELLIERQRTGMGSESDRAVDAEKKNRETS
jgi:hypothetical protein